MVYSAESLALCALEVIVNVNDLADDYVSISIELRTDLEITSLSVADLPSGWDAYPSIDDTRDIGTNWARGLTTAVLSVPSAVIPRERNYLLNPAHPEFGRIRFAAPSRFTSMTGWTACAKIG